MFARTETGLIVIELKSSIVIEKKPAKVPRLGAFPQWGKLKTETLAMVEEALTGHPEKGIIRW